MEYRTLGWTGVKVSPICLGTANFADPTPEDEAIRIINRALDAGINLIDSGDSYANGESERIIGKALAGNGRRQQVILATKVHYPTGPGPNDRGNSRLHLIKACEDSLRRLRTDYIDLYQIHRPAFDMSVDETLGALTDLVRQGKVRYIGCSTHPAWKIMEALMVSQMNGYARYVAEQPPYNLLDRRIENEIVPLCQAMGWVFSPGRPWPWGYWPGDTRTMRIILPTLALSCVAESMLNESPPEALRWALNLSTWPDSTAFHQRSWPCCG